MQSQHIATHKQQQLALALSDGPPISIAVQVGVIIGLGQLDLLPSVCSVYGTGVGNITAGLFCYAIQEHIVEVGVDPFIGTVAKAPDAKEEEDSQCAGIEMNHWCRSLIETARMVCERNFNVSLVWALLWPPNHLWAPNERVQCVRQLLDDIIKPSPGVASARSDISFFFGVQTTARSTGEIHEHASEYERGFQTTLPTNEIQPKLRKLFWCSPKTAAPNLGPAFTTIYTADECPVGVSLSRLIAETGLVPSFLSSSNDCWTFGDMWTCGGPRLDPLSLGIAREVLSATDRHLTTSSCLIVDTFTASPLFPDAPTMQCIEAALRLESQRLAGQEYVSLYRNQAVQVFAKSIPRRLRKQQEHLFKSAQKYLGWVSIPKNEFAAAILYGQCLALEQWGDGFSEKFQLKTL